MFPDHTVVALAGDRATANRLPPTPAPGRPGSGGGHRHPHELDDWIGDVIQGRVQDIAWTSPKGFQDVLRHAAQSQRDWDMIRALRHVRQYVANEETHRALKRMGLRTTLGADSACELIERLRVINFYKRRVAVQVDHDSEADATNPLLGFFHWVRADLRIARPQAGQRTQPARVA